MAKRPLSPQEIDRRAGAVSPQNYKKGKEDRLRRAIRNYRATMQVSLLAGVGAIALWFVINIIWHKFGPGFGWELWEAWLFLVGALSAYFVARQQLRRAKEELGIFTDNRERGRIR